MSASSRTIKVDALARVEGEGALLVRLRNGQVKDVKLRHLRAAALLRRPAARAPLLRGARHHRAHLRHLPGRLSDERGPRHGGGARRSRSPGSCAPCGACSTAASGSRATCCTWRCCTRPTSWATRAPCTWRRTTATWSGSRSSSRSSATTSSALVGGREIHPVNVRVGGFYKLPRREDLRGIAERLKRGLDGALQLTRAVAAFEFPDFERDYEFVALRHPDEYPLNEGRLVSSRGLDIAVADYEKHFQEEHVAHSNALHSVLLERGAYHVGPLARYSLNFDRLPAVAQDAATRRGAGAGLPESRSAASWCAASRRCSRWPRRCASSTPTSRPSGPPWRSCPAPGPATAAPRPRAASSITATRSTRAGLIQRAKIVPPTAQNQKTIEDDVRACVTENLALPDDAAAAALRAGDPQLRSVHLLRHALPEAPRGGPMSRCVVIGVGNRDRGDDAAGLELARRLGQHPPRGAEVRECSGRRLRAARGVARLAARHPGGRGRRRRTPGCHPPLRGPSAAAAGMAAARLDPLARRRRSRRAGTEPRASFRRRSWCTRSREAPSDTVVRSRLRFGARSGAWRRGSSGSSIRARVRDGRRTAICG